MIINVTTLSELYDALANATGGETIKLAPGDYGDLVINGKSGFDTTFSSEVQIVSADPENPAVFSGMDMREAANLTFDGITFDYTFEPGDTLWDRPFDVMSSENITIRNSTFDGDLASGVSESSDGYGYAIGLSFRNSSGITVEQNEFFEFYRGMTVSSSEDIQVLNNDVHSLRMDGFNFSEVTGVLIEGNHIHDFNLSLNSLDHSDMIQFWTNGTDSPSSDIVIRGNHLDVGDGDATQSIFMRNDLVDRGLAGQEMFYQNLLIENNVIVNGHRHGITVGESDGLVIRHNTVLHDDGRLQDGVDPQVEIPRITVAETSTNVVITQNITSDVVGQTPEGGWRVQDNAFVQDQDPTQDGYYGHVFVSSSLPIADGTHNFLAVPGGVIDLMNAGAPSTLTLETSAELTPRFHVTRSEDSAAVFHFDASMSTVDFGPTPPGTVFQWEFPDGSTQEGAQISHTFARGGTYDVNLTAVLPGGETATLEMAMNVTGSSVLSYDANEGMTTIDGVITAFSDPDVQITSDGIALSSQGVALSIAREDVRDILGRDEFNIALELTAGSTTSAGEIMRVHTSFTTSVTESGEILFEAFTEDGQRIRLTTQGANITDMATHDVGISLLNGVLAIHVDNVPLASTNMTAPLAENGGSHGLVFGNPWGRDNFEGVISGIDITVDASNFAEADIPYALPVQPEAPETPILLLIPPETHEATPHLLVTPPRSETPPASKAGVPLQSEAPDHALPDGVALGDQGVAFRIDREDAEAILERDAFSISLELTADGPNSAGEVMRLHQSFVTAVTTEGEFYLQAFTQDGGHIRLTTQGADLNDRDPHNINITLNDGVLDIIVDGVSLAQTEMSAPLANEGRHDLVFGNPWGLRDNFEGVVSSLNLAVIEGGSEMVSAFDGLLGAFIPADAPDRPQRDSEAASISEDSPNTAATTPERINRSGDSAEEWINHLENQLINSNDANLG